ncbi:HAD family hydrolase [Kineothrix sedimenti]|uniref:HAD family hydrolase n=1 Tax=Kineothrix sedimenti TaxID=3123317 RepID=A0ABZ3EX79_9FIRM
MRNKNAIFINKHLAEYHAVILDVDGTLYSQPSLRFFMAIDLLKFYLSHPLRMKELFIIKKYRFVRENWANLASESIRTSFSIEEMQYTYVAEQMNTSPGHVQELILYWLHKQPLKLIAKYRDSKLIDYMKSLRENGTTIVIYSDYPAKEKLDALGICPDYVFCSSDVAINCMKPDPKAMYVILEKLHEIPENVVMIGDRYSKDGLAAENAGMDFVILEKFVSRRISLYQQLFIR